MTKEEIEALIKASLESAGFLSKQEFGATAAMIGRMNKALEGLVSSGSPLDKLAELGMLEKQEDGTYKPKSAAPARPAGNAEPEWKVEIEALKAQNVAKDKQIAAERKQREDAEVKNAVIAALEKAGAVNPSRDYVHVLPQVKRTEDGKVYVPKTNVHGAEEQIALDVAFGDFLKSNPELRKTASHAGSGTPAGAPGGRPAAGTDVNTLAEMPMDQFMSMRKAGK
jgi:hypothetical protein